MVEVDRDDDDYEAPPEDAPMANELSLRVAETAVALGLNETRGDVAAPPPPIVAARIKSATREVPFAEIMVQEQVRSTLGDISGLMSQIHASCWVNALTVRTVSPEDLVLFRAEVEARNVAAAEDSASDVPEPRYVLVTGHRRLESIRQLHAKGMWGEMVPVEVLDVDPDHARVVQLAENMQRLEVHWVDTAAYFAELAHPADGSLGLTQEQIAQKVGVTRSFVAHTLQAYQGLCPAVLGAIRKLAANKSADGATKDVPRFVAQQLSKIVDADEQLERFNEWQGLTPSRKNQKKPKNPPVPKTRVHQLRSAMDRGEPTTREVAMVDFLLGDKVRPPAFRKLQPSAPNAPSLRSSKDLRKKPAARR